MSGLPLVILAVALSLGTQPPPKKADPAPPMPMPTPKKDSVVEIQIVVRSTLKELEALCIAKTPATTIFVENVKPVQVHHCIGNTLHNHSMHAKNQKAMDPADVKVSVGQRIRWVSETAFPFFVVDVTKPEDPKHEPQDKLAPLRPFGTFTSKVHENRVETSELLSVGGGKPVVQRYKVTFNIQNIGLVDPDLICTM